MSALPSSILIVRLSAIGDVIHALPVLDALRQMFPDARLGWIVEELSAPLLQDHPQLDQLYVLPKKRWKKDLRGNFNKEIRPYFRDVKADGWDVAIDLQGLTKSGLVVWASGAKRRIGYGDKDAREINRVFTNDKVRPPQSAVHVVERNLSLLMPLSPDGKVPCAQGVLHVTENERDTLRTKLREAGWDGTSELAALNPGAGWVSKQWAPGNFAATGRLVHEAHGLVPLVVWGPGEEAMRDVIAAGLQADGIPHIVAPNTRIRELAVMISLCSLFIGGDTGPTHMAGMLGVPTAAIFGASDGARNRPWPPESAQLVQRDDLFCCPCWKTACPLEDDAHMACLRGITPGQVAEAAAEALAQSSASSS